MWVKGRKVFTWSFRFLELYCLPVQAALRYSIHRSPILRPQPGRSVEKYLPGRNEIVHFGLLGLQWDWEGVLTGLFKIPSFFLCHLRGQTNVKTLALQDLENHTQIGKPHTQVGRVKVEQLYVWFKPFIPKGEGESWVFPDDDKVLCLGWGLWWECVSGYTTHLNVDTFSVSGV